MTSSHDDGYTHLNKTQYTDFLAWNEKSILPNGLSRVATSSDCTEMSGQSGGQRLCLSTLNEQLTCKICGGYFIDATTIIECLHSFCKSCIVKYLENNKFCPICNAQVHKSKPLLNIRPDQILQDIVYKLVPGCYQNEMRCRKEFYAKHPDDKNSLTTPEARGEPVESYIYSPDESLSLSLEYYNPETVEETNNDEDSMSKHLPRRYLRCPAAVTVFHLQKLIRAKYGLSEAHRVDIMYKEEPLNGNYTLMDVMYIYHWKRKVPLHLSYRIFESASKRLKMSNDNNDFKQSLTSNNIEMESKDDEQSVKREWKEVQLKISETGVMSVTDISNLDTKKSTKVNEINQQSNLDQVAVNAGSVNNKIVKEEKESMSSCNLQSKNKKVHQENSGIKGDQVTEEKSSSVSSANSVQQDNLKSEEMKVKTIDQLDLSNELMKSSNERCGNKNTKTNVKTASIEEKYQAQNTHDTKEKIKTEAPSEPEKRPEMKNNSSLSNDIKPETRQNAKLGDSKQTPAGSKINALSAKLQFQPKVGQVNNTYSKKSAVDKKATPITKFEPKDQKSSPKSETKLIETTSESNESKVPVITTPSSNVSHANSNLDNVPTYVTASSGSTETSTSTVNLQQQTNNVLQSLRAPTTESLASIGLHVSTTIPSQVSLNSWLVDRAAAINNSKNTPGKVLSAEQQLRSLPGMPQIGKDIVCTTTTGNTAPPVGRFSIQTPSMSIYSIPTTLKNNVYPSGTQSYSSPSKQTTTSKPNLDVTTMYPVPPCPDAIPISLMKANTRKDAVSKGTTLNEICAKISNANTGSKINDICAKIGESSKEKSKEIQRVKPEVPDLLKISKKSPVNEGGSSSPVKHIPNIPNVPIYTPSNSQALQAINESKDSIKRSAQAAMLNTHLQKMTPQKKPSQAVGYKTLRDPPKSWNPTLSKNNYVAAKNQAKEMQNQTQATYGITDGNNASKQIPSKPAKIFKIRNMPRYLGNPASGVKPMYGVTNEQSKEKEQSSSSKNSPTMMKIDPQTLSPIVSSPNSPIVSPPPYSPTARSYQNTPFSRDICRNSNSPISPRNSPVNMLSTNPFIPSHTPNTNPRLIYSHFPPGFPDPSRFSNPLIRSPINLPPPSAFHSSLPPSINKLYQRSGYMTQPQTNVAGFSPGANQPPTVQRIPPSSHSSSPTTSSSPSSSKSPKTSVSSKSPSGAGSPNTSLLRSESLTTTSLVDSVALQLAKGLVQRDLNAFDLTKTEALKSSTEIKPQTLSETTNKSKSTSESPRKSPIKQSETDSKNSELETKSSAKDIDKIEKDLAAKINGGITLASQTNDKPKVEVNEQQQSKSDKISENVTASIDTNKKSNKTQEGSLTDGKKITDDQEKQKADIIDTGKTEIQGKKSPVDPQKSKVES